MGSRKVNKKREEVYVMKRNKIGLALFVVGAVLLGLATWGGLLWYGLGIRSAYPFGIVEYPAMPAVDPFQGLSPGFPFWGGFHLYLWSFIPYAAAMLILIGGLVMAQDKRR
jgi:hypothetical protein